jgi:hypothetical protein
VGPVRQEKKALSQYSKSQSRACFSDSGNRKRDLFSLDPGAACNGRELEEFLGLLS